MHPAVEEIARQLREVRVARGVSQGDLSERIGITQAQISRFERGRADLRLGSLVELGRGLGLEVMLVPRARVPAVSALGLGKAAAARFESRGAGSVDRDGAVPEPADG